MLKKFTACFKKTSLNIKDLLKNKTIHGVIIYYQHFTSLNLFLWYLKKYNIFNVLYSSVSWGRNTLVSWVNKVSYGYIKCFMCT